MFEYIIQILVLHILCFIDVIFIVLTLKTLRNKKMAQDLPSDIFIYAQIKSKLKSIETH